MLSQEEANWRLALFYDTELILMDPDNRGLKTNTQSWGWEMGRQRSWSTPLLLTANTHNSVDVGERCEFLNVENRSESRDIIF